MTTAELIQKREEEQKKPLQEQKPDLTGMAAKSNPADVTMQKIDNEANNKAMAQEAIAKNGNVPMPGEKVSLYDAGMNNPDTNNMKDARTSPITSPEYEKFRNEVIGARQFGVETEEQRKKRERAEAIKQGLVGFTEGLSALANLYYTTKGAPSQKLTSQMPDLQKRLYEERLERDKKLEKFRDYIRGKADLEETRSYQEKLTAENRAYQDGIRKAQWEREDKIREQNQANLDRQFEYNATKNAEQTAYSRERDKESDRRFWATHNENVRHNKAAEARSGEKGKGRLLRIQKPNGEPMVFQKDDLENIVNLSYIYNSLPDEYKVRDKSAIPEIKDGKSVYPVNDNPTKAEMQAAIGRALQSGVVEEIAESIQIGTSSTDNSKDKKKDNDDDVIIWTPKDADEAVGYMPKDEGTPKPASDGQPATMAKKEKKKGTGDSDASAPKGTAYLQSVLSDNRKARQADYAERKAKFDAGNRQRLEALKLALEEKKEVERQLVENYPEVDYNSLLKETTLQEQRLIAAERGKISQEKAELKKRLDELNQLIGELSKQPKFE